MKGGFLHFDAFVYRVHNDTDSDDLKEYIGSAGVEVIEFEKQSKDSAPSQSFRVRFKTDDYRSVMDPEFWPQGICIRKFYRSRSLPGNVPGTDRLKLNQNGQ